MAMKTFESFHRQKSLKTNNMCISIFIINVFQKELFLQDKSPFAFLKISEKAYALNYYRLEIFLHRCTTGQLDVKEAFEKRIIFNR